MAEKKGRNRSAKSSAAETHDLAEGKSGSEKAPVHKKEESGILDTSSITFWQGMTVIFSLLFILSVFTNGFTFGDKSIFSATQSGTQTANNDVNSQGSDVKSTPVAGAVKLDFYVMSKCPYGVEVENAIKPVLDKLGNNVDFNLNFIATANTDNTFNSLHGQTEVDGDIVQLCAAKYSPGKYMDMIVCQNKNAGGIPGNWEQCAKDSGIETAQIKTCYEGDEGKTLMKASIEASTKVGARGSPTIYLNGKSYSGGRASNDFLRAICNAISGTKPDACASIPAPKKVNAIIINDKRCGDKCDISDLTGQLEGLFPGMVIKNLDYSDKEAKDIMNNASIKYLPAVLFDDTVTDGDGYSAIQRYLEPAGKYQNLRIGSEFDPSGEICDNKIDDNKDGKTDCDDSSCSGQFVCMAKLDKPTVELFVMSHCPYGTQIEKGMLPVVELLGSKIDFTVKFVDYAMHGEKEIQEEMNQYCIETQFNNKYLAYLKCFLKEGNTDSCVTEAGIDKAALDTCIASTDTQYKITANFNDKSTWSGSFPPFDIYKADNEKYGVQGSPTLVINGVTSESGRSPSSLLSAVCTGFKDKPSECSSTLSSENPSPGFGFETTGAATQATGAGCGV